MGVGGGDLTPDLSRRERGIGRRRLYPGREVALVFARPESPRYLLSVARRWWGEWGVGGGWRLWWACVDSTSPQGGHEEHLFQLIDIRTILPFG